MNYLAHFHLAVASAPGAGSAGEPPRHDDEESLIIGALLGDYVKGPLRGEWPAGWERGIALHRRIDALTDSHPEVIALLEQLPRNYRRYGGIMFDVCFDYCLSHHWRNFHDEALPDFNRRVYRVLDRVTSKLPADAARQASRLQRYDVLGSMAHWQTVDTMLCRIGQRLRRQNPLDGSAAVLARELPSIEQHFLRLYPQLLGSLQDHRP